MTDMDKLARMVAELEKRIDSAPVEGRMVMDVRNFKLMARILIEMHKADEPVPYTPTKDAQGLKENWDRVLGAYVLDAAQLIRPMPTKRPRFPWDFMLPEYWNRTNASAARQRWAMKQGDEPEPKGAPNAKP